MSDLTAGLAITPPIVVTKTSLVVSVEVPEFAELPPSKADQIRNVFYPMAAMLAEFEAAIADVTTRAANGITPEVSADARRIRLDIAKIRVAAEKERVKIKAQYLLGSKAIDGANNILKWAIEGKEETLQTIERHAELVEAQRVARLGEERTTVLGAMGIAAPAGIGEMDSDVWDAYLTTKRRDRDDRIEAERVAAAQRAEQERIRAVAVQRSRGVAPVYDFFPAEFRDDPTGLSDEEFSRMVIEAENARAQHAAEVQAERERAAVALREVERLEAERRAAEQARADLLTSESRRQQAEAFEVERLAKEAAEAPVKARLQSWVTSFRLPDLAGESHPTERAIRKRFEKFRESAAILAAKLSEGNE